MILTDTCSLVALNDPKDSYHTKSVEISRKLGADVLLMTWQFFTEAMHLLGKSGGHHLQKSLWEMRRTRHSKIHPTTESEADRVDELMKQYLDSPMDLADASLIAAAESRSLRRVFTVDLGFLQYRLSGSSGLEIVQQPW